MLPGWTRIALAGKAAEAFEPPQPLPFVLLFLHDENGQTPATHSRFTDELRKHRLRCIAPLAPGTWWVDRICPDFDSGLTAERYLLEDVLSWIHENWSGPTMPVAAAGIGMGGQGALRLAFKYAQQFPVAASIGGALDFQDRYGQGTPLDDMYASREQCRQDSAILHIQYSEVPEIWFACSTDDRWHRGNDRLHEKLAAMGLAHTPDLDQECGNDEFISPLFSFVVNALHRKSRQLM